MKSLVNGIYGWGPPPLFVDVYLFMKGNIGGKDRNPDVVCTNLPGSLSLTSKYFNTSRFWGRYFVTLFPYYPDSLSHMDNGNHCCRNITYGYGGAKSLMGYERATKEQLWVGVGLLYCMPITLNCHGYLKGHALDNQNSN